MKRSQTDTPGTQTGQDRVTRRLSQAESLCRSQGQRFTSGQLQLYRLLLSTDAPMSAYQLLDVLGRSQGKRIYPQTVYRTLALLQARGLVHKLESANAYLPCTAPTHPHESIHLLCDVCGNAEELVDAKIGSLLSKDASRQHFRIQHQVIELCGVCAGCDSAAAL